MKAKILLIYKNFAAHHGISHIGLGVSASTNAHILKEHGIHAIVVPCRNNIDVVEAIRKEKPTHVVISAPWLKPFDLDTMARHFKGVHFVVVSHSNVGFLQADPGGVKLLRIYIEMGKELPNLRVGANCKKFANWLSEAYEFRAVLLPNLYPNSHRVKTWNGEQVIQIGTFGAVRPQKNVMTAAAAALIISKRLKIPVEFNLSTGREDGGGGVILSAIRQMVGCIPGFHLVERHWTTWHDFRRIIRQMNLLIQVSYTESFNMVTADGIAEGVPSVVSHAIDWAPKRWKAEFDDAIDVAEVGIQLLRNDCGVDDDGIRALEQHNSESLKDWFQYLAESVAA